jgi:hypothetical protein
LLTVGAAGAAITVIGTRILAKAVTQSLSTGAGVGLSAILRPIFDGQIDVVWRWRGRRRKKTNNVGWRATGGASSQSRAQIRLRREGDDPTSGVDLTLIAFDVDVLALGSITHP